MGRSMKWRENRDWRRLGKMLPVLYFFFVFLLYFSMLSEPYFTDEQDVFYGAYNIIKGKDIYAAFLSQHMPFSYYFAALIALCGARTVFQFRLGIYVMLSALWTGVFLRHRRKIHPAALALMPLVYLTILKTLYMGTAMISDHWQGIGLVLILMELVRYTEERQITSSCAGMVSLGIVLSLGSTFASAYSVFCYFLGMVVLQADQVRKHRRSTEKTTGLFRQNIRLAGICLLPFALLAGWYVLSDNFGNFVNGSYEIVTQVYSKYTGGLGSDPVSVIWETPGQYGLYLKNIILRFTEEPGLCLLYLAVATGMAVFCIRMGRRHPAVGFMLLLASVYGGLRGFEGFHSMAYYAQASAMLCLCAGRGLQWAWDHGRAQRFVAGGITCALGLVMLMDFIIWAGYNTLYPQILLDRTLRCEEEILDLLTDPDEEVFACNAPINSLDMMDLELIPSDACSAITYPYFYEMWGERQMTSIRKLPHVVLYNRDESIWGYVFSEYAPDFDTFMQKNYTKLPQAEDIWVSNEYAAEAWRRLEKAGYGNRVISNETEANTSHPVEYLPGQSVEACFTAEAENLKAIRFCGACFYRRSSPTLTLQLRDGETGEPVGKGCITGERIADNFFSRCPIDARVVPGRSYELQILVERIDGKGDMEFYFQPDGQLTLAVEYQ